MCISVYTKQQQLAYLNKIQHLRQFNVLKDDVHLTYQYRNRKKVTTNVHSLQDKIQEEIVDLVLEGDYPNRNEIRRIQKDNDFDTHVENAVEGLLTNERKRIHRDESKFVDHVVDKHTQQYTNFLKNRLTIEAQRIIEKAIIIEGKALDAGATPEEARQQVLDYAQTHGKARTRNIIKDAVHSQECNVSFIKAIEDEYRYKVWMNGNRKGNTRKWHIAKYIQPVPIDEPFSITGPYGRKDVMFPGDLNGGPENVANCRCWLRYTNHKPSGLRQTVYNVPSSSYLNTDTRQISVRIRDALADVGEKVSSTASKVKTSLSDVGSSIRNKFKLRR